MGRASSLYSICKLRQAACCVYFWHKLSTYTQFTSSLIFISIIKNRNVISFFSKTVRLSQNILCFESTGNNKKIKELLFLLLISKRVFTQPGAFISGIDGELIINKQNRTMISQFALKKKKISLQCAQGTAFCFSMISCAGGAFKFISSFIRVCMHWTVAPAD